MADRRVTFLEARPIARASGAAEHTGPPWWATVLLGYAAARVVTTLLLLWVRTQATDRSRQGAHPSLLDLAGAWDGEWYRIIATTGYPRTLPVDADGLVVTNPWAFLPVYPALVKWATFGVLDWRLVAVVVSVVAGGAAAVLLAALLLPHVGRSRAVFASALFSCSPLAFVLQLAYAEALGLAFLLAALVLVDRRRYVAAIPPALLLAFTRPGALALAPAVAVVVVVRWVGGRRAGAPESARAIAAGSLLVVVTAAGGLAWTAVAAIATGRPDAYVATEGAWRALWMPGTGLELFRPWWFAARFWAAELGAGPAVPLVAAVLLVAVVGGFAALLASRPARRLGVTALAWCAAYACYLLAVFFPQSSVFRLLMPMAPLTGALVPRSGIARIALLAVCTALQALWLWVVLGPVQSYWTVP